MRRILLLASLSLGLVVAPPVRAQAVVDVVELPRPTWAAGFAVQTSMASPLVGVAVALPSGSGLDPADQPGAGRVAAEAVGEAVERRLGTGNAEAQIDLSPTRTILTFLVRPDRVEQLFDVLTEVGFGSGPGPEEIGAARARHANALRFQVDSPLREVGVERRALLYGTGDPRTRRPEGRLAAVESMPESVVEAARRTLFDAGEARVVAVGPIQAPTPAMTASSTPAAGGTTADGPAWTTGDRRVVTREVTNTWLTVAFPVPADLPRIAVLYVADRMALELNASPPDPGLFNASVSVVEMPEGEVVLVEAAVLPESADGFESRILALPAKLGTARDPAFFRFNRGRFRATRLVEEAAPEAAARRMAAELLTRGQILDFEEAVWTLDADTAADAAIALGTPRILVFGPDLGGLDP